MNIKPSDLPLLVSLDMLLEERNVTRAASRLHVSQPALSAQLVRLRRLFKDPLLIPSETGRGMVATPKAEEMADALRKALSRLNTLADADEQFDPTRDSAMFRVGGSFSAITMFAGPLIQSFQDQRNRQLRLAFRSDWERADVLPKFENGEIDILLVAGGLVPAALKTRQLMANDFVMVQRRGHPRGTRPLTLDEFCSLGHLVISPDGRMTDLIDLRLKELGRARDVLASTPHVDSIGGLINDSDLVCTLPKAVVRAIAPGVEAYSLPFDQPDLSLAMAWHTRLDKQPAHRWLRKELTRISRGMRPTEHAHLRIAI